MKTWLKNNPLPTAFICVPHEDELKHIKIAADNKAFTFKLRVAEHSNDQL